MAGSGPDTGSVAQHCQWGRSVLESVAYRRQWGIVGSVAQRFKWGAGPGLRIAELIATMPPTRAGAHDVIDLALHGEVPVGGVGPDGQDEPLGRGVKLSESRMSVNEMGCRNRLVHCKESFVSR